jgi:hypothetical protein
VSTKRKIINNFLANQPPLIDANGDGIGQYSIFQLDKDGVYHKSGRWQTGNQMELEIEQVRKGLQVYLQEQYTRKSLRFRENALKRKARHHKRYAPRHLRHDICALIFAPRHLRHDICATTFAPRHMRLDICATTFVSRHLRHDICALTFAPRHLRHDICATTFAPRHLRHDICAPTFTPRFLPDFL